MLYYCSSEEIFALLFANGDWISEIYNFAMLETSLEFESGFVFVWLLYYCSKDVYVAWSVLSIK